MSADVFIEHATALAIWHRARIARAVSEPDRVTWIGAERFCPYPQSRASGPSAPLGGEAGRLRAVRAELGLPSTMPLHVMVASHEARSQAVDVVSHIAEAAELPAGSFRQLSKGVLVSSPELVFLRMASMLDLEDLVELGFMACGTYSMQFSRGGDSIGCPPIMRARDLVDYLGRVKWVRGIRTARRAARLVLDGSNSPRETHCALQLGLPALLGGLGCSSPRLNRRVPVGDTAICPDFYWPEKKLVGEYNGGDHGTLESMLRDARRSNKALAADLKAFTVTKEHFSSPTAFDEIGDLVCGQLGMRRRKLTPEALARRMSLRRRFMDPSRTRKWEALFTRGVWE